MALSAETEARLNKIRRKIDPIGGNMQDEGVRKYLDAQLVIIHRTASGMSLGNLPEEAKVYLELIKRKD